MCYRRLAGKRERGASTIASIDDTTTTDWTPYEGLYEEWEESAQYAHDEDDDETGRVERQDSENN